jgi:wyosine [tRNA(Phe)-imidazoG37] synthetase (radical SAM superfamily)
MATTAAQLSAEQIEFVELFREDAVFDLYGRWNSLVAETAGGVRLGWCRAHDGDFFPESPLDHAEAMRAAIVRGENCDLRGAWPVRVDVDITQRCTSACVFCFSRPYYSRSAYRGSVTGLAELSQLLEDLAARGTRSIRYCGGGDPLTHPDIEPLLRSPRKCGLRSCVITNGDLLDDRLADVVFDEVDHLRWSVNAATNATRRKLHRPGLVSNELTRIFESVERIADRRRRERPGERRPMIWATFLVMAENLEEVVPVTESLKRIGVDSLSFRPVYHNLGGAWSEAQERRLRSLLEKAKSFETSPDFLVFIPKRALLDADSLQPAEHFSTCLSRQLRTVVESTSDGLAIQTCGMWRGTGPHSGKVIGNGVSFASAWSASKANSLPAHAPNECHQCMDVSANVTLNFIWEMLLSDPAARFYKARIPTT